MFLHLAGSRVNSGRLILASTSILITRFENDLFRAQTRMTLAVVVAVMLVVLCFLVKVLGVPIF